LIIMFGGNDGDTVSRDTDGKRSTVEGIYVKE
jgi:hypothetical protein